ncbi:MAG: hypothetical protein ACRC9E_00715, partial [Plesiomonas shigelloides]
DADQIELINNFYIRVIAAESARLECKSIFNESLLEKARQMQSKLIENIYENIDNQDKIARVRLLLIQHSNQETLTFYPDAPKTTAFKELVHIHYVSPTPTGEKLKKLARIQQ